MMRKEHIQAEERKRRKLEGEEEKRRWQEQDEEERRRQKRASVAGKVLRGQQVNIAAIQLL